VGLHLRGLRGARRRVGVAGARAEHLDLLREPLDPRGERLVVLAQGTDLVAQLGDVAARTSPGSGAAGEEERRCGEWRSDPQDLENSRWIARFVKEGSPRRSGRVGR
jgi:hypothetical protein